MATHSIVNRRAFLAFGFGSVAALAFKDRAAPNPRKPPSTTTTTTGPPAVAGTFFVEVSSVGVDAVG